MINRVTTENLKTLPQSQPRESFDQFLGNYSLQNKNSTPAEYEYENGTHSPMMDPQMRLALGNNTAMTVEQSRPFE
jgi:hypothetical protein